MQIKLVSLEDGITSCGFRKMAAFVARINEDTESCYVSTNRYRSIRNGLRGTLGSAGSLEPEDIDLAARDLIKSDLVGFSSMTGYSDLTRKLIKRVKELDPSTYVIWGGIHPIIHPEDAILSDSDEGPDALRVTITPMAARAFIARARRVISAGRPSCPLCSLPLDATGHVCPRQNGYRRRG